ncbi:3-dehydroquinate synthase [Candidatus Annandia adelgestsuga]|uniref:3-dehydroquinate synthase n=1 Tax=Candidatus Annandia adelgestsuga TaxID=1302411 RepID=A0A3Q9CP85_9ENTR|nr:3-dehydroquinate synthase [Candidatus Annandia adelgestsuga]AZP36283.1 3-dehydroquinate synthase [Candidatus Annandia adelgestsuga]
MKSKSIFYIIYNIMKNNFKNKFYNEISVKLKNDLYKINIGYMLLKNNIINFKIKKKNNLLIITNKIILNLYKDYINNFIKKKNIKYKIFIIKDGESYKNIKTVNKIINYLLSNNYDKNTILISLGGGVIGDITGFTASIYHRGIKFIQIPTTLLSQVDASIGGKTGVNHKIGKNMIGTFYQPIIILTDIFFLKTLSKKELKSGLVEVIKYGIIFDKKFFNWIEDNINDLININKKKILYCVNRCCEIKSFFIKNDEKENNIRSLLNLGHTYGHAIESYTKYKNWSHGESVASGIIMSCFTSEQLNIFKKKYTKRIIKLFKLLDLNIKGPDNMNATDYIKYMKIDKKATLNKINLIIPIRIGKAIIMNNVSENIIIKSINKAKKL